jgi:hypothetical protein
MKHGCSNKKHLAIWEMMDTVRLASALHRRMTLTLCFIIKTLISSSTTGSRELVNL